MRSNFVAQNQLDQGKTHPSGALTAVTECAVVVKGLAGQTFASPAAENQMPLPHPSNEDNSALILSISSL
jgi:hypothetical protein